MTRRVGHKTQGTQTGMGIYTWLAHLFAANEAVAQFNKLTDEQILRRLVKEFPNLSTVTEMAAVEALQAQGIRVKKRISINRYRGWYNRGNMTRGVVPKPQSRRYDSSGRMVHKKTGKPLKQEDGAWLTRRGSRLRDV